MNLCCHFHFRWWSVSLQRAGAVPHGFQCPPPAFLQHTELWAQGSHSATSLCSAGLPGLGPPVNQSINP